MTVPHGAPVRTSPGVVLAIVLTELVTLGSLTVPVVLGLAVLVRSMDLTLSPEAALSIVLAPGAVAAMIANIGFGRWSDRRSRAGRGRSVFVVGGVVGGALAIGLVVVAPTLPALVAAWCLAQVAYNATFAVLYASMSDVVPELDRARVSGWFGASAVGAVIVSTGLAALLPKDPATLMLPMALIAIPVAVWATLRLSRAEPVAPPAVVPRHRWWDSRADAGQYWRVWAQRFLMQLAYGFAASYGLFYLMRRVGLTESSAATWVAATASIAAVVSALASVLAGRIAGREGAYGSFIVGACLLLVVALGVKATGTTVAAYVVASLLLGIGIGIYYAVDLALVLRAVPSRAAGQLLGLFNAARTLPQSLAPALAPALLAIGDGDLVGDSSQNYTVLFGAGLVVALVALLPLRGMTVLRRRVDG